MNKIYIRYYLIYINFIVHAVIPFAALFFLNISIYRKVYLEVNQATYFWL